MTKEDLKILEVKLREIIETTEASDYDISEFQESIYQLEDEIYECYQEVYQEHVLEGLQKLENKIKTIKREHDFFDAEIELDFMFPDKHSDDFDEDSMSYDSIFGDD